MGVVLVLFIMVVVQQQVVIDLDMVIVIGYCVSVEKVLDIKCGEVGVVDVIVVEDIGKFFDLNLVELLQCILGVVIICEVGEGCNIFVCGLGLDFICVCINGMEVLIIVGVGDQSGGINRGCGFDFNVFVLDLFLQLLVCKIVLVDVEEGLLGVMVDLCIVWLFDYEGFIFVVSGQVSYNVMVEKVDSWIVVLVFNIFVDGIFGVLFLVVYFECQVLEEGFNIGCWVNGLSNGNFVVFLLFVVVCGVNVFYLCFLCYVQMEYEQKCLGVIGLLQWKFGDVIEILFDVLYLKIDVICDENYIEVIFFSRGISSMLCLVGKLVMVVCNGVIENNVLVQGEFDNVDICFESCYDEWSIEFKQIVLNGQYCFGDDFILFGKIGILCFRYENFVQIMVIMDKYDVDGYSYDYCGNNCVLVFNYGIDLINFNGWELVEICLWLQYVDNDFDIGQIDFNWNFGLGFCLKGGVLVKDYMFSIIELCCVSELVVFGFVDGMKVVLVGMIMFVGLKGINGSFVSWVVFDFGVIVEQFDIYSNSGSFVVVLCVNNVCSVEEKDRGVYLMGEFFIELGSLFLLGNVGVWYVCIKQFFIGLFMLVNGMVQIMVNCIYDDILFLFNLVVEVMLDFLIWFGVVKVMSWLGLGSLMFGVIVVVVGGVCIIFSGNFDLDLICVINVDFGFEWYFVEGVMVGIGLFYKDIESFIQIICEVCFYSDSGLFVLLLEGIGVLVSDDFIYSKLVNMFGGELYGVEVNYMQFFIFLFGKWVNFGIQLNYIWVELKIQYFNLVGQLVMKIDFIGLLKLLWNVMLFYEGEWFVGCILVINCDDYLIQVFGQEIGFNLDGYYGMIGIMVFDVFVCYKISDQLELSLEGINLINEVFDEWVYLLLIG